MKGTRNDGGDSGNDYLFLALFSMIINAITSSADVRVWVVHWENEGVSKWALGDEWHWSSFYVCIRKEKDEQQGGRVKEGRRKELEKKRIKKE